MRITGGDLRGRKIKVPKIEGVRPTSSRVREALFNIMGDIEGQRGLDLFSGSGIVAVEALSRGAKSMVSIESSGKVCRHLNDVAAQFKLLKQWHIQHQELPNGLDAWQGQSFDFVFADPPYRQHFPEKICSWLAIHHIETPLLILEESSQESMQIPPEWEVSTRKYGNTCLNFCHAIQANTPSR
ncbi:MAG: 16S rRNA (guanine(966)-N(2))-methyltransferase RsmD [Mariprofundaceae bacterium]|nr:16S rRNA (guanine(966)-N(2))-methyltransferase RsmD [Mariprofundaceae bacterium]